MHQGSLVVAALLACAAPAAAQDFGTRWSDKVTRELYAERGALDTNLDYAASGGLFVYHDSNLLLEPERGRTSDAVLVPFVQGRLEYTEPTWDLAAELIANYKSYADEDQFDDDEERAYARAFFVGSEMSVGVVANLRHESDPTDVVFADRVERLAGEVMPRIAVDLTPVLSVELAGLWQFVRFDERAFADAQDSDTYRGDLALVYETEWAFSFVADGGLIAIRYVQDWITPDADGWYVRGGIRGEPVPELRTQVLAGYMHAESDDLVAVNDDANEEDTPEVLASVVYTGLEQFSFTGSYSRTLGFAGGGDPFQIVNRGLLLADFQATEYLSVQARGQYDFAYTATGVERTYVSVGGGVTVKPLENVIVDAGATYRTGETEGNTSIESVYDGVILYLGAALAF